jgi:O-succinylbenzoic acid--CoA ligase
VRIGTAALDYSATATHTHLGGPGQWLLAMSPARIAGLTVLVRSRAAGVAPVALDLSAGFRPEAFAAALAAMEGERRYTALVPTQLIRLLDAGIGLTDLDAILLGGGPIPLGLPERAAAAGVRVVRTYGMTETCGGCVYDGVPLPGVRLRIDPAGLICLAGPVLGHGYLGPPPPGEPATSGFSDGWFISSDLGRVDADGVLHVHGRADDVIVTGGVNVAAQAVEAVLAGQPGVAAVSVVGRPDPEWGMRVVALLVPDDPARPPDPEPLRAAVAGALGRAHVPREFRVAAGLPLLPSGKVDRDAVRRAVQSSR